MTILDVLDKDMIKVPLRSTSKQDVIEELVGIAAEKLGWDADASEAIIKCVNDRENLGSTAIGNDIAIPHAKSSLIKNAHVVIGLTRVGVDFGASDGSRSRIFFLVLANDKETSTHVEILSSIARSCSSEIFRRMLELSKTADDVYRLFVD